MKQSCVLVPCSLPCGCAGKLSSCCSLAVSWGGGTSGLGSFGLVLFIFLRALSRCPLMVASDFGGYFRSVSLVRPGIGGRYPLSRAVCKVDIAGENSAACAKETRSSGLVLALTAVRAYPWCGRSTSHRPLVVSLRTPLRTVFVSCVTVHLSLLKVASHPASHSFRVR